MAAEGLMISRVALLRLAIIASILLFWEALAESGLLFRDVVPSLFKIAHALGHLGANADFYANLSATAAEVGVSLAIGGSVGVAVGLLLGGSRLLGRAFEPYIHYLGPTPKIIFFPVMIMWFGIGPGSKIAMGAISCFFPVALITAAGMRQIDQVLIRVGRSFRASTWQMVTKIYFPALRHPLLNGLRLGFGVSVIGVLLAETKLSNRGLGFMVMQSYSQFDMPGMYALLLVVFSLAIMVNSLVSQLGGLEVPNH